MHAASYSLFLLIVDLGETFIMLDLVGISGNFNWNKVNRKRKGDCQIMYIKIEIFYIMFISVDKDIIQFVGTIF